VDRHDDLPAFKVHSLHRFLPELFLHVAERQVAEEDAGPDDAKGKEEEDPASEGGAGMGKGRRHGGYGSYVEATPTKAPSLARMMSSLLFCAVSGFRLWPSGPMLYRSKSVLIGCRL